MRLQQSRQLKIPRLSLMKEHLIVEEISQTRKPAKACQRKSPTARPRRRRAMWKTGQLHSKMRIWMATPMLDGETANPWVGTSLGRSSSTPKTLRSHHPFVWFHRTSSLLCYSGEGVCKDILLRAPPCSETR